MPARLAPVAERGEQLLAALGVSWAGEVLYRSLLRRPDATLDDLVTATGWHSARVRRHLRALEALGLVTRGSTRPLRFTPAAPDAAVEILALRRQEDVERARIGAGPLLAEFRAAARSGTSPVTVVRGREAIAQRFLQAQRATRREVLILDRPPYVVAPPRRQNEVQHELLRRGVTYRTIYDQSSLDAPDRLAAARELAALGEHSRVLAKVPLKLVITDRSLGLVPFVLPSDRETLVLQTSALLDGLIALFDLLWQRATPLWTPGAPAPAGRGLLTADEEQLLALAATGLTDEAIARRLGVGQRTIERRMRRVMTELGAQTRFQAGLQAARLGILGDPRRR